MSFQHSVRVPGSKSMLKRVWKLETRLKEKKACSHSKCTLCSVGDKLMDALKGKQGAWVKVERANLQRAAKEHDAQHLGSRAELDKAGTKAFTDPREMWTVLADAATQRNFMLPKLDSHCLYAYRGRLMCFVL